MQGTLVNLNELIAGHRLFDIPLFQRGYAWEERNLEDLWEDIYYLDASKQHYFGTVLLKDSGETSKAGLITFKKFDVIDGQQRLTTAQILMREIISQMKCVSEDDTSQRQVSDLEEAYLKYNNLYKLNPLGNDRDFFRRYVINNEDFMSTQANTASQRRLVKAKSFFRQRLEEQRAARQSKFKDFLTDFWDKFIGLQLMQYIVNSDADAIRIFETANDRGRPLSNLEKTKSFLMHTSYLGTSGDSGEIEDRLHEINGRFSQIYQFSEDVGKNDYIGRFSANDFQRYHFIDYISPDRKRSSRYVNELKDIIRNMLRQDDNTDESVHYVLDYAKDLEQAFFAVQNIDQRYQGRDETKRNDLGNLLSKIFMVGRLGNIFPLLIATWLRYGQEPAQMAEILKLIEAFTFRVYLVGKYRSNAAESRLHRMAYGVHRERWRYETLIAELKKVNREYRNDTAFEANLRTEDFYHRMSSHDKKYLLTEYEIRLGEIAKEKLTLPQEEILSSSNKWQVEHIWPQNPSDWDEYDEAKKLSHEHNVHRLGNLTITAWNPSLGNKPFEEKRDGDPNSTSKLPAYVESDLRIQRDLRDYSEWTPQKIREREDAIVEFALERWKV